jgi:hypothetical protein
MTDRWELPDPLLLRVVDIILAERLSGLSLPSEPAAQPLHQGND